jgi:hypothetical protein
MRSVTSQGRPYARFRRAVAALERGRRDGEPAGQIAARELEVVRTEGALRRAEQLTEDVAVAIEQVVA